MSEKRDELLAALKRLSSELKREPDAWIWPAPVKRRECYKTETVMENPGAQINWNGALDELRAAHAAPIFVASSDRQRWEVMARGADGLPVQFRRSLGFRVAYIDRHADANQRYCWRVWAIDREMQSGWMWDFEGAAIEANKALESK